MPESSTSLNRSNGDDSNRPVAYLLEQHQAADQAIDLQRLLAPIWRWRWVQGVVLVLGLTWAVWNYLNATDSTLVLVVHRGDNDAAMVESQLREVVIPGAVQDLNKDWRPEVLLVQQDANDPETPPSDLYLLTAKTSSGTSEEHARLREALRERVGVLSKRFAAVTEAKELSDAQQFEQSLVSAKSNLREISAPPYVNALRARLDRDLAYTKASVAKARGLEAAILERESRLSDREETLQSTLSLLLDTINDSNDTAGLQQVFVDRITSIRLELEQRIPAERIDLRYRLGETRAELLQLAAQQSQQELEAATFDLDLDRRQSEAQTAVHTAEAAKALFQARVTASMVHQPLSIIEEFSEINDRESRLILSVSIAMLSGLTSLAAAYVLEGIRLGRQGVMQA